MQKSIWNVLVVRMFVCFSFEPSQVSFEFYIGLALDVDVVLISFLQGGSSVGVYMRLM